MVHVLSTLEQLFHVQFDVTWLQLHALVLK